MQGEPVAVRMEIGNPTASPITLDGWSVPWVYHWAVKFDGDAIDPLVIADPGVYPGVTIGAGQTASGAVAIGSRLEIDHRRLSDAPGAHRVRARSTLRSNGGEIPASCTVTVKVLARTPAIERALATARSIASAQYDLTLYPLADATEENGGFDFFFEHVPPEPPGGHFSVRVEAGRATLHPGE